MRVSWYRGAGASMAAGEADRRADAVGVEERSAVRCPLMKRLGCRPASSTLMFRMSKSGRAARRATIDRGSRREGLTLAADRRMAATDSSPSPFLTVSQPLRGCVPQAA
jgi:hypothetical protein